MIKQITGKNRIIALLDKKNDIFTGKIRSLFQAYGLSYPFCEFFCQDEKAVIGRYYNAFTAANLTAGGYDMSDIAELSGFLRMSGASGFTLPEEMYSRSDFVYDADINLVMCAEKPVKSCKKDVFLLSDLYKQSIGIPISIGDVYEIVKSGFDIDFNTWYTDINHNIRHGISAAYVMEKACCAVRMFSFNGISYYSYICTKEEYRGRGLASELLSYIIGKESESSCHTYIICRPELKGFYEKNGFTVTGRAACVN